MNSLHARQVKQPKWSPFADSPQTRQLSSLSLTADIFNTLIRASSIVEVREFRETNKRDKKTTPTFLLKTNETTQFITDNRYNTQANHCSAQNNHAQRRQTLDD